MGVWVSEILALLSPSDSLRVQRFYLIDDGSMCTMDSMSQGEGGNYSYSASVKRSGNKVSW